MTILVLVDWYLPSFKAGGPVRAVANRIEVFGNEFDFKIITGDRDWREPRPHPGIDPGHWYNVDKAKVMYLSPRQLYPPAFLRILRKQTYDAMHIHGFFSLDFVFLPLLLQRLKLAPNVPTVLAPLGSFSPGHLEIKRLKKRLYIQLVKWLGLSRSVIWQASTSLEETDIRTWFGTKVDVLIAQDMPGSIVPDDTGQIRPTKTVGQLKLLYVSRITRKKNLDGALEMLRGIQGNVEFNIYGPVDDQQYWEECQQIMRTLPQNIQVEYRGAITPQEVYSTMRTHHLFFLPTHGENFGYVILEALSAGCPVLISDQTPWLDLEANGVGWNFPVAEKIQFGSVLQQCLEMDEATYHLYSSRALKYGISCMRDSKAVDENRALLLHLKDLVKKGTTIGPNSKRR